MGDFAIFTGREVEAWKRPCVYILWRKGRCEYVGASGNGVARPLDPNHHAFGRSVEDDDELLCLFTQVDAVFDLERTLIELLRPTRNGGQRKRLGIPEFFKPRHCRSCFKTFAIERLDSFWCPDCRAAQQQEWRERMAPRACSECGATFSPGRMTQRRCGNCRHHRRVAQPIEVSR